MQLSYKKGKKTTTITGDTLAEIVKKYERLNPPQRDDKTKTKEKGE